MVSFLGGGKGTKTDKNGQKRTKTDNNRQQRTTTDKRFIRQLDNAYVFIQCSIFNVNYGHKSKIIDII